MPQQHRRAQYGRDIPGYASSIHRPQGPFIPPASTLYGGLAGFPSAGFAGPALQAPPFHGVARRGPHSRRSYYGDGYESGGENQRRNKEYLINAMARNGGRDIPGLRYARQPPPGMPLMGLLRGYGGLGHHSPLSGYGLRPQARHVERRPRVRFDWQPHYRPRVRPSPSVALGGYRSPRYPSPMLSREIDYYEEEEDCFDSELEDDEWDYDPYDPYGDDDDLDYGLGYYGSPYGGRGGF